LERCLRARVKTSWKYWLPVWVGEVDSRTRAAGILADDSDEDMDIVRDRPGLASDSWT
jgi:hypothetical protein